jgi:hypothetical protein
VVAPGNSLADAAGAETAPPGIAESEMVRSGIKSDTSGVAEPGVVRAGAPTTSAVVDAGVVKAGAPTASGVVEPAVFETGLAATGVAETGVAETCVVMLGIFRADDSTPRDTEFDVADSGAAVDEPAPSTIVRSGIRSGAAAPAVLFP